VVDLRGLRVLAFRLDDEGRYQQIGVSVALTGLPISLLEQTLTQLAQGMSNSVVAQGFAQAIQALLIVQPYEYSKYEVSVCLITCKNGMDKETKFMPRKIRELKAQISREGFIDLSGRGKGSHERWRHPLLSRTLTIPGKDGDDVPRYLEKQLAQLLIELETLKEDEHP
jgi:predicted RNA binding protein YcfA (HicA-like mRNA interferase family)